MEKTSRQYHVYRRVFAGIGWACIILAVLCMLAVIVSFLLLGLGKGDPVLVGWLCGGSAGGAVACGGLGFLFMRRSFFFERTETDAEERADSEDSYFIGEGTLATFGKDALRIHRAPAARGKDKTILVPYDQMRIFSVCMRRAPREKGEWCVALEIPARYLLKEGKVKKDDPPMLVEADGKPRIYASMKKYGLSVLGELPPFAREDGEERTEKFTRLKKFVLPDRAKRRRALIFCVLGLALAAGGIGASFWQLTVGALLSVMGIYLAGRSAVSYVRSCRIFSVYREGIFLKERNAQDSVFLKWEEFGRLTRTEDGETLRAECPYGSYDFPCPAGAYEWLSEQFPDQCGA